MSQAKEIKNWYNTLVSHRFVRLVQRGSTLPLLSELIKSVMATSINRLAFVDVTVDARRFNSSDGVGGVGPSSMKALLVEGIFSMPVSISISNAE